MLNTVLMFSDSNLWSLKQTCLYLLITKIIESLSHSIKGKFTVLFFATNTGCHGVVVTTQRLPHGTILAYVVPLGLEPHSHLVPPSRKVFNCSAFNASKKKSNQVLEILTYILWFSCCMVFKCLQTVTIEAIARAIH